MEGKYGPGYFHTMLAVVHRPTGYRFHQEGGRIRVWLKNEEGEYKPFSDFTVDALQIEHTVLTEAALRRAAVTWLKDNLKK